VKPSVGESAEVLIAQELPKTLVGDSEVHNKRIVLAELGRFPLQIHFWQQILRYHHKTMGLDSTRLVTLAMMDGFTFGADQSA